jgi:gamma-glutamyl-gamma-aminobutyrate hydrolase PuuD
MSAADNYSDEKIEAMKTSIWPGERNSAPYLAQLDTPERRLRAIQEAHTLTNLIGMIHSQAVYHAVSNLKKLIENGNEDKPLYGEATAKKFREAEAERKAMGMNY